MLQWHSVETIEEGITLNISLMAKNYANLLSSAINHILLQKSGWCEAIVDNSLDGGPHNSVEKLHSLLQDLPEIISSSLSRSNGTGSILPEPVRRPTAFAISDEQKTLFNNVQHDDSSNSSEVSHDVDDNISDEVERSGDEVVNDSDEDSSEMSTEESVLDVDNFTLLEDYVLMKDIEIRHDFGSMVT